MKIITILYVIVGILGFVVLSLMLIDILQSRLMHLHMSSVYHANTDISCIILLCLLLLICLFFMTIPLIFKNK